MCHAVAVLVAVFAVHAPTPADAKPSKAAVAFEALKQDYDKALQDYQKKTKNAAPEELAALSLERPNVTYLPRCNDLAEKYADDPVAFDILLFALRHGNGPLFPPEQWDRTMDLLAKHFATDERMKEFLLTVNPWGEGAYRLLRAVREKHPDKLTQARACKSLLRYRQSEIVDAEYYLANPAIQTNIIRKTPNGKAYYGRILNDLDAIRKEADEWAKLLKDKYAGLVPDVVPNKPVPDVTLTDLDGKTHKLSDYKGKIVVVNLFSTEEGNDPTPALASQTTLARLYKGQPVVVLNVSLDAKKETFADYLKAHPLPAVNCWVGPHHEMAYEWLGQARANPTNLVLDPDSAFTYRGVFDNILFDCLDRMIAEASATGRLGTVTKATKACVELRGEYQKAAEVEGGLRLAAATVVELQDLDKSGPCSKFTSRFNDLAEKYADDPAAFHILRYNLIEFSRALRERKEVARAVELLAKRYATHPEMKNLLRALGLIDLYDCPDALAHLARAVFEKNKDLDAQARACRLLVAAGERDLSMAQYYLDRPADREKLETDRPNGPAYFKELIGRMDTIEKEIVAYKKLLKEKYADYPDERPR